jgi:hypothetical protein
MFRKFFAISVLVASSNTMPAFGQSADETKIPVDFVYDRMFAKPTFKGVEAQMLLDTGGNTGIYSEFAWYWKTEGAGVESGFFKFSKDSPFATFPYDILQKQSIRVLANDEEAMLMRKVLRDGIFGHGWFGGRVWRIDYPNRSLLLLKNSKDAKGKKVELGFKSEALFYPRFQVQVEGVALNMLFDTGATSFFSPEAVKKLGLEGAFSSSSFIRQSVYDKWKAAHPDWHVIEGGDRFGNQPLIRVPVVVIAGKKVGPVWFARRSNDAYDKMMAEYMDCNCDGAIGGNAFRSFKTITIDYPGRAAWFE